MTNAQDNPNPCMAISDVQLKLAQVEAAMKAMMDQARATSETPVVMAIVDAAGNLEAFAKMDNARLFTRRHAVRKAYSAAILGIKTSAWAERMKSIGHSVGEWRSDDHL